MSLQDLASVTISTEGAALTQVGFGTLLCAAYEANAVFQAQEYTRTYTDLAGAVADGFSSAGTVARMLTRAFAQNPRPANVKVGKLTAPATQTVKFGVVGSAQNSTVYRFTMTRLGVSADIIYTSDSSATVSEIVNGLATAVEASTLASAVAAVAADTNTTCQIVEGTPGVQTYYSNWSSNLTFADLTTDPVTGYAAQITTIRQHDADWYGCAIDHNCNALSKAVADYVETLDAMFFTNVSDTDAMDSGVSTDLGKRLMTESLGRTLTGFDLDDTGGYGGVAMAAERFPHDPGSDGAGGTFHGKTLVGVTADALSPTQKANLRAKHYVVYETTAGRNHTLDGKVSGGEFADVVRGLDWFRIRLQERIATAILNNDKIPFTDRGISVIRSLVEAQGKQAESVELFVPGSFTVTVPKLSETQSADRAARKLTGVKFSAQLAGAIHLVEVTGSVTT